MDFEPGYKRWILSLPAGIRDMLARYYALQNLVVPEFTTITTDETSDVEENESVSRALQLAAWLKVQRRHDDAEALTYEFAPPDDQKLILSILEKLPEPRGIPMLKSMISSPATSSESSDSTDQAGEQFTADMKQLDMEAPSALRRKGSYENLGLARTYFWSVDGHGESSKTSSKAAENHTMPVTLDLAICKAQAAEYDVIDIDLRIAKLKHARSCNGSCAGTSSEQRNMFVHSDTLAKVLAVREVGRVHPIIRDFRKSLAKERKAYRLRVAAGAFAADPELLHATNVQHGPSKASCPPLACKGKCQAHGVSCELETLDSLHEEWSRAIDRVFIRREAVDSLLLTLICQNKQLMNANHGVISDSQKNVLSQCPSAPSSSTVYHTPESSQAEEGSCDAPEIFNWDSMSEADASGSSSNSSGSPVSSTGSFHTPHGSEDGSTPFISANASPVLIGPPSPVSPLAPAAYRRGGSRDMPSPPSYASLSKNERTMELTDGLIKEKAAEANQKTVKFKAARPPPLDLSRLSAFRSGRHISFVKRSFKQKATSASTFDSSSSKSTDMPSVTPRVGARIPIDSSSASSVCRLSEEKKKNKALSSCHSDRPASPFPRVKSWFESLRSTSPYRKVQNSHTRTSLASKFTVASGSDIPSLPPLSMASTDLSNDSSTLPGLTEMDLEIARWRRRDAAESWEGL